MALAFDRRSGDATGRSLAALVLSPGIPPHLPRAASGWSRARADAACPIIGDIELLVGAARAARSSAITGTNGKSTTTALIGPLLRAAGRAEGGNIGLPY